MKRWYLIVSVTILSVLLMAACGSSPAPSDGAAGTSGGKEPSTTGGTQGARYDFLFATGGTGGTYYPLGGVISEVWKKYIDNLNVTVQSTGGSVENIRLLGSKETELALAQNNTADYAYKGVSRDFENNPIRNFMAIGVLYPEIIQIVAKPEIKSIEDLKGKRVAVGPPGSGTEASAREIFEFYGLNHVPERGEVNFEPHFLAYAEAGDAFRDGHVDALFTVIGAPAAIIQDIATQHQLSFLSITGEPLKRLQEKYPFYAAIEVPAGTYPNQDQPFHSVALQATLFARDDLDEEIIYQMTKVLYEKADEIAQGHDKGNDIKLERALDGVTVPVHPGAERYYKEQGVLP